MAEHLAAKQTALAWIEHSRAHIVELSDTIWGYAEPALREYKSARLHCTYLRDHGLEVQEGVAGMPTAFLATYGSGTPVIGFYAEYDATPGNSQKPVPYREPVVPHAAGFEDIHNGLGVGSTAAIVAVRYAMEQHGIPGTVKIFGTPAEKLCLGKAYLARDGFFDDLDAVLAWHPWTKNTVDWDHGPGCYEASVLDFHGTASWGARPWSGASALDATTLTNVMANYMKEHMLPPRESPTLNELQTVGGQCPTNLPEFAQVWYVYRAATRSGIETIRETVRRCAQAACLVTGCTFEFRIVSGTRPFVPNHALSELVFRNFQLVGPPRFSAEDKTFVRAIMANLGMTPLEEPMDETLTPPWENPPGLRGGADDYHEFSWHAPSAWLHVAYGYRVPPEMGEFEVPSWSTAALAKTGIAHTSVLTAAKTLAASAVELLATPEELAKARHEYRERTKDGIMPVALPPNQPPPIDLTFPPYYPEGWTPPTDIGGMPA